MDISAHSAPRSPLLHRCRGFSLVEVALAIGVVSFGLLATVGLIPVGLNSFHKAIDVSISSQVVQRVVNDARQTDFAALLTSTTSQPTAAYVLQPMRYFDSQGNELSSSGNYIYQVNTRVTPQTILPNSGAVTCLATVTIQIGNNPGHQLITVDPQSGLLSGSTFNISTFSAMVAQNSSAQP